MAGRDGDYDEAPLICALDSHDRDLLLDRLRVERRARHVGRHGMVALTDQQLGAIMDAAALLPAEKRSLLLERVAAWLQLYGRRNARHFSDVDIELAVRSSLQGLAVATR